MKDNRRTWRPVAERHPDLVERSKPILEAATEAKKVAVKVRLLPAVIEHFRADGDQGDEWQARMHDFLMARIQDQILDGIQAEEVAEDHAHNPAADLAAADA